MKTATFDPDGGPLVVEIQPGGPTVGTYSIFLWESGTNEIVDEWRGNFINTDDDHYELPIPVGDNDGRILDGSATIAPFPPHNSYGARMTVTQDGRTLAKDEKSGTSDQATVTIQLFIQLEEAE